MEKLTRQQMIERLALLEEKKRRDKRKKPPFVPNPGQKKVLEDRALVRVCTAGNSGGKSVLSVVSACYAALGKHEVTGETYKVPNQVIVLLDRPSKADDKWVPEIRKFFDTTDWDFRKNGRPNISKIVVPNGSEIIFMSWDMNAMAFESIDGGGLPGGISLVCIDEPCARWQYIALRRAGRSKGAKTKFLIVGTPVSGQAAWLRTDLYEKYKTGDKEISFHNFSSFENRANLDDGYLESFSAALSEKEQRVRLQGEWVDIDGMALAHLFQDDAHIMPEEFEEEWDPRNPHILAIDVHPSKAHVAMLLGVDSDDQLYVVKELTRKEVARDFARTLKNWTTGYTILDSVVDNLGSADMTGGEGFKSFIEILNEEGLRVRPTRYDEKVDADWITRLQNALLVPTEENNYGECIPKLRIFPSCRGIVSDIKNVQWVKVRNVDEYKPTLDIGNKDYLSCLKYALACNLYYVKKDGMRPVYNQSKTYGVAPPPEQRARIRAYRKLRRLKRSMP